MQSFKLVYIKSKMNGVNKDDVELGNVEIKESAPLKHEFEEQTKPRFTGYKRDELLG